MAGKEKQKDLLLDLLAECVGSFLIAITTYNIALYASFPLTGFSGISMILYRLFKIPMGMSSIVMNIPVAILCWKMIGKGFLFKSFRCMVISSVMLDYLAPLFPVYMGDRMVAALITGTISGIGYALIYLRGSSTGGADFIIMAVKVLKPHINLGTITNVSGIVVILAGSVIFRDLDGIVYGMIINLLAAVVVDKMILGMNSGKVGLIVTRHGKLICEEIDRCCRRGSTILNAVGGYQYEKKDVVMVAGTSKDIYQIQKRVKEADPESFMIILESREVQGEGFRITRVAGI